VEIGQWSESVLLLKKDAEREPQNANAEIICPNELSQPKQSPAVGHGDCLGAAQDVQFSEQRLDVALDAMKVRQQGSPEWILALQAVAVEGILRHEVRLQPVFRAASRDLRR